MPVREGQRIGVVYALIDPRDYRFRYIGVTYALPVPKRRYLQHLSSAKKPRHPVSKWIAKLQTLGLQPHMIVLVDSYANPDLYEWEHKLIKLHKEIGTPLLNVTEGGRGGGYGPKSPEHRAKVSKAQKGRKQPPRPEGWGEAHAAKLRGRKHTQETITKMRESAQRRSREQPESYTAYKRTPEHRAIMSAAQKKRYERQRNQDND